MIWLSSQITEVPGNTSSGWSASIDTIFMDQISQWPVLVPEVGNSRVQFSHYSVSQSAQSNLSTRSGSRAWLWKPSSSPSDLPLGPPQVGPACRAWSRSLFRLRRVNLSMQSIKKEREDLYSFPYPALSKARSVSFLLTVFMSDRWGLFRSFRKSSGVLSPSHQSYW